MDNLRITVVTDRLTWGVRPLVLAAGVLATAAAAAWLILSRGSEDRVVAGFATVLLALVTLAGTTMLRRLSAGPEGFTVRGPLGTRHYRWSQVVRIAAPARRRRGLTSVSVELDLEEDGLVVLGRLELGADPAEVAAALSRLRAG